MATPKQGRKGGSTPRAGSGVRGRGRPRKIPLPLPLTEREKLEKRLLESLSLLSEEDLARVVAHAEKIEMRKIGKWVDAFLVRRANLQNANVEPPRERKDNAE